MVGVVGMAAASAAQVQVFPNDYAGFVAAAGPLSVIDFETLPDGTPSVVGTPITDGFNYDRFGPYFSAPFAPPYIAGNPTIGFGLRTFDYDRLVWIQADLSLPTRAVGAFFLGSTTIYAYGVHGQLLGSVSGGFGGEDQFAGLVSEALIARVRVDRRGEIEEISTFYFSPVPEPTVLGLAGCTLLLASRRGRYGGRRTDSAGIRPGSSRTAS